VPYVVGARASINVAMDWTDFDADDQATIMLSLLTRHGRRRKLHQQNGGRLRTKASICMPSVFCH
jgi:hypothetical protein